MAGMIPPNLLEQIRTSNDIVEVIQGYLPLKRAGGRFTALCPFHKEKTPSFYVNPQLQVFKCFGCGKGGDVFTFVREYEGLNFMEAVRRLAERARIPLQVEERPGEQQSRSLRDTLLAIHEQIAQRWQSALAKDAAGQIARDYLAKRGVSPEAVKEFRLGYAPETWDDTVNWAKGRKYDLEVVKQAGLIVQSETGDRLYDRFRGRLMFPIADEQGRVIAFSGRILAGDEKTAKYVNSPETPIFTKGRVFYGLHKSKRAILDARSAVICEGQLDLIACYMAGVRNVVAPQGTAFTEDHARILKRYADEVVLCFDGDAAGQKAAVRALDSLLAVGLAVRVAQIPPPEDPDSFVKKQGAAALQKIIREAPGFFDFFLDHLCASHSPATDKGRLEILREMGAALQKTGNRVFLDTYARKTALRLGVAPDSVLAEFRKMPRGKPATADEPAAAAPEEAPARPAEAELWLLKILLTNDQLAPRVLARLDPNWLSHPLARRLVALRAAAEHSGNWPGFSNFLAEIEEEEMRNLVAEVAADDRPLPDPETNARDTLRHLRNQCLDARMRTLNQQMSQPGATDEAVLEAFRQSDLLARQKRQPIEL